MSSSSPTPKLAPGNGSDAANNGHASPSTPGLSGPAPRKSGKPQHMNGPLYRQANGNVVLVRRPKRKNEGPLKQLARWFVDNQIGASSPVPDRLPPCSSLRIPSAWATR